MSAAVTTKPITQAGVLSRGKLLLLCAGILTLLWALRVNPYLNVADDAGRYMVLGESLAKTGDLRLLNDVRQPLDTLYPPGFPALIAFWLLATGRDPGQIVLLVKATQLLFLLGTLPLLYALLERARLPDGYRTAALLTYSFCPGLASYANEVMSEAPFLFFCLSAVVLVERFAHPTRLPGVEPVPADAYPDGETASGPPDTLAPAWQRVVSLACAALAFLTRTAAVSLLIVLPVWFWRRFGAAWGVAALVVALAATGGWQWRNQQVVKAHPEVHHATYIDQFSLRDPSKEGAGRIPLNGKGLASRAKSGLPTYIGMIPRTVLYMMKPGGGGVWLWLFYAVAVPLTLLILLGFWQAAQGRLWLTVGFAGLFWLFAAMWPWRAERFIFPLLPFWITFLFLGVRAASEWLRVRAGTLPARVAQGIAAGLFLLYACRVHAAVIGAERRPTFPGYTLGRSKPEGGFYAACDWLRRNAAPNTLVMGKPAYILHLYSGHPVMAIEPTTNARAQEKAYIVPNHVRYLVQDAWTWGTPSSADIFKAYFAAYGKNWKPVWQDANGSGVQIWERLPRPVVTDATPLPSPPTGKPGQ